MNRTPGMMAQSLLPYVLVEEVLVESPRKEIQILVPNVRVLKMHGHIRTTEPSMVAEAIYCYMNEDLVSANYSYLAHYMGTSHSQVTGNVPSIWPSATTNTSAEGNFTDTETTLFLSRLENIVKYSFLSTMHSPRSDGVWAWYTSLTWQNPTGRRLETLRLTPQTYLFAAGSEILVYGVM